MSDDKNGAGDQGQQQNGGQQQASGDQSGQGQQQAQGQQGSQSGDQGHQAGNGQQQQQSQAQDGKQSGQQQDQQPAFPEDWREKYAKGDEKKLGVLKRYASYEAAMDALFEARQKISQGTQRPKLPDNATPEQIAEYRQALGVPETPDKYDVSLGAGHVWGEADKPLLESFTKAAHDSNVPAEYLKPMLAWYDKLQQDNLEKRTLADAGYKKANVDRLASEWGGNLGMETRIADEFMQQMGPEMYEQFKGARDAQGNLLFANADFIRWANKMQRELNPAGTVLPGAGINSLQAAETRKAEIEAMMGDQNSAYWKGEKVTKNGRTDTKLAIEYGEILQALERQQGRRAA